MVTIITGITTINTLTKNVKKWAKTTKNGYFCVPKWSK
jgi:hypothetical protein